MAGVHIFLNERERPRQWHNKGASSTRAQAAGPPPIPRVPCPCARTNKQATWELNPYTPRVFITFKLAAADYLTKLYVWLT
jgi:hypothetical protein